MVNQSKPLTVYKASAGSGKTFTLAVEYITLLINNPQSYNNILAVTFTNKATEEMKMRILSQLYGIWKQLDDSEKYTHAICQKLGQSPSYVASRAGIALQNLLHNFSYFRVETIDTFFQSILRNMARELDVATNIRIGLNDYQVEEMAVDRIIEDLNKGDKVLQWLLKYIMDTIDEEKSWNVISQIKSFGKTIFKDDYKAVSQKLGEIMSKPGFFNDYSSRLQDIRREAVSHMQEHSRLFFDTLDSEHLTVDDFAYGKTGVCSLFIKLQRGEFDESIVGKRVADSIGDPSKWCKKSHPRYNEIVELAETTLEPLLKTAVDERPQQWKRYKSAELTLKHLDQLRLLGSIEQRVRELNQDANRFLLSDTQQLLFKLIDGSDSPFIFEKIGAQLEHVMIDEFQDTSTVQWQNFKILLNEAMSHKDTSNLIVGDVKQSIYRWRSGDWQLLNNIEQQFADPARQLDIRTLSHNYRSDKVVIGFNNAFFQEAARQEYAELQDISPDEALQLSNAYKDVEQMAATQEPAAGYVDVRLLSTKDYQQAVLRQVDDALATIASAGQPSGSTAILVRNNVYIPIIAQHLAEALPGIKIVSDEAFRLDASLAVNIIITALRLLANPDDQLSKAFLAKAYQMNILKRDVTDAQIMLSSVQADELLPPSFLQARETLMSMPLYELCEQLYKIFSLQDLDGQSAYVCSLLDYISEYVSEQAGDINGLLDYWEEELCGKTIQSDDVDGIRIISIHKSKGLEFENVIVPFCDWQLEKSSGNIIWCKPEEEPFSELPIIPVDYSRKALLGTIFEKDYVHEHLQNTVDNLNLLYVAFTRAERRLFVIGRRREKSSRSWLIEQTLPQLAIGSISGADDDQQDMIFTYGTIGTPADTSRQHKRDTHNVFLKPSAPITVAIEPSNNKAEFRQSNSSRDFVKTETDYDTDGERNSYIDTGRLLHQIFSTIRTTADIDSALERLQGEGVLYDDKNTAERLSSMLRKRLEHPKVADWFSGRWTLFNECSILTVEDDEVVSRRPDRVMTDGNEWVVVDFKFGKPDAAYHDQVREYMNLLRQMGHSNVTGYLWYVYSNKMEEIKG